MDADAWSLKLADTDRMLKTQLEEKDSLVAEMEHKLSQLDETIIRLEKEANEQKLSGRKYLDQIRVVSNIQFTFRGFAWSDFNWNVMVEK